MCCVCVSLRQGQYKKWIISDSRLHVVACFQCCIVSDQLDSLVILAMFLLCVPMEMKIDLTYLLLTKYFNVQFTFSFSLFKVSFPHTPLVSDPPGPPLSLSLSLTFLISSIFYKSQKIPVFVTVMRSEVHVEVTRQTKPSNWSIVDAILLDRWKKSWKKKWKWNVFTPRN